MSYINIINKCFSLAPTSEHAANYSGANCSVAETTLRLHASH